MAYKTQQPWPDEDLHRAISMRRACVDLQIIADTLGRTVASVRLKLSRSGIEFPPLRHGRLKYDKAAVARWRGLELAGFTRRQISELEGVHEVIISRKYAQEIYRELVY